MIGKMKSNISLRDTLEYNIKEYSQIVSINNVFGEKWKEIEMQMLTRQKLYDGRAKNLTAHIFLSPSISDGKSLTLAGWKEIANSFLRKAGLTSHQSIAFLHQDKGHTHLHIVVNRIDESGKLYRHKNELALSQRLGDEIAQERGMVRASQIRRERQLSEKFRVVPGSFEAMRADMSECIAASMADNTLKLDKYFNALKAKGYKTKMYYKRSPEGALTEKIAGYAIGKKGERLVKASTLGTEFTLERIRKKVNPNSEVKSIDVAALKKQIDSIFDQSFKEAIADHKHFNPQNYFQILTSRGLQVKEHFNRDTGKLRGYGVELNGQFFNSSEIGIDYTIRNLTKKANELTQQEERKETASQVASAPLNQYFNKPKEIPFVDEKKNISRELIRAIDLVQIENHLKDSIVWHQYKSYDEFIKAIEEKGYHVHLRYSEGQLAGYIVHRGCEHYSDKEIGNGEFSLHELIKSGRFVNPEIRINPERQERSQTINANASENDSTITPNTKPSILNSPSNFTDICFESENSKENAAVKNSTVTKQIIPEIFDFAKSDIIKNVNSQLIEKSKDFPDLKRNENDSKQTSTTSNSSINLHNSFLENERKSSDEDGSSKEKAKRRIAMEILNFAKKCIQENKSFDSGKFLNYLRKNGFNITEHKFPNTGILRGYSVQKYGFGFYASELGKEFTLASLKKLDQKIEKGQLIKSRKMRNRI